MQGVASRDIKLENTLLDGSPRPLLKICDFGYSKVSAQQKDRIYSGRFWRCGSAQELNPLFWDWIGADCAGSWFAA